VESTAGGMEMINKRCERCKLRQEYEKLIPSTTIVEYHQLVTRQELYDTYSAIEIKEYYKKKMIQRIIEKAIDDNLIKITEEYVKQFDAIELKARMEIVI